MGKSSAQLSRNIGVAALIAAVSIGCGTFETKKKGRKAQQNAMELAGEWRSNCVKLDWLGLQCSVESYAFTAIGDFDKKTTVFSDEGCATASAELVQRGTYDELGGSKEVQGAKDINFTVVEAGLAPKDARLLAPMNAALYCGHNDWAVNVAQTIIDRDCGGKTTRRGQVIFDLYQVADKTLHFGDTMMFFNKSNPAQRPNKLDAGRTFTKK